MCIVYTFDRVLIIRFKKKEDDADDDAKPAAIVSVAEQMFKDMDLYPSMNGLQKDQERKYVCKEPSVVIACLNELHRNYPDMIHTFGK